MSDYEPVVRAESDPYSGAALIGTHSAIVGWSLDDPALREGLLGFAVHRLESDTDSGTAIDDRWLGGYKHFPGDDRPENERDSRTAPFQRFRWNDYTLRPGRSYRYEVFPVRGTPDNLTMDEDPLVFEFGPTPEDDGDLGIYVNRGVTAAKAYFDRFGDVHPSDVQAPDDAYGWLSRGLKESLIDFIAEAKPGEALHVAIYEFFSLEIAQALKDALDRGVDVRIVHDAKRGKHSTEVNLENIDHFGLEDVAERRTTVNISHNKVVVHLIGGSPKRVWTGSANFSENAFNYQSNTALVLREPTTCGHFESYFQGLRGDPSKADSKKLNEALMAAANAAGAGGVAERFFFSPISRLDIVDAASELIAGAQRAVLVSGPFGVHADMIAAMEGNSNDIVEYGLANATASAKIAGLRKRATRFFPPKKLKTYHGERWDAKAFGAHKIHAKTVVVDPYGENPKVLIGSANFSKPSCKDNDENAMLITGNPRLAAVIATEFMRMFDHYKSRFYIDQTVERNKQRKKEGKPPRDIPRTLETDHSWSNTAFSPTANSHKFRDRVVFAGQ
jgi:phosphatidylserine/phosphatidylglycerophosphate/cardiolipin synthase-like enzyme